MLLRRYQLSLISAGDLRFLSVLGQGANNFSALERISFGFALNSCLFKVLRWAFTRYYKDSAGNRLLRKLPSGELYKYIDEREGESWVKRFVRLLKN